MLVNGGVPTGIWPSVSFTPGGGVAVPGRPPAPLPETEPVPLHGRPVIGFVPVALPPIAEVVPGKVPGLIGETGGSGISGKLNGLERFCAKTIGPVAAAFGKGRITDQPFGPPFVAEAAAPISVTATAVSAVPTANFTRMTSSWSRSSGSAQSETRAR